ncbi:mannose-6-phosphate isomerase 1-like [Benincasa hispida]|uniref:mannose-6-phosphate isomerase 1-like n=1 Tax=Benincasa hispida TaxID=102211 RepID=UPI0019025EF0|nr:mannose-6-phosphate isomerase 1-like [Benincasa hispida]XP_038875727.1 mannose-6-phosphate isomerase 1-like [Benincasa hispida]XP_038875728.1 mannose-6-phosphate isomerase 1-like [Benincasa hispida]XP_038875729.1 mannose-6-phosphate isomerase 1-like [Benincasa hispida]
MDEEDDNKLKKCRKKRLSGADRRKRLLRLKCCVQNYDWGVIGCNSQVARLFLLNSGCCSLDPRECYAEFWIGTHKSGPSFVVFGRDNNAGAAFGSKPLSLKDWISVDPGAVLGDKVARKWGGDLPFLFKVLSIEKALSIQAHPDKDLARSLNQAQPSIYKDDNHKPEMALALTGFEALCGFISSKELKVVLSSVPEIVELVQCADAEKFSHESEQDGKEKVKQLFESIFSQIMSSNKGIVREAICKLKRRLSLEKKKRQLSAKEQLILRLEGQYPADVGILAAFFLNYVELKPGEALYVGPNEPHAYISGECIECMATSDNVVRAGLTSKKRDVQALLSMLNYKQGFPEILQGVSLNEYTRKYAPPFDEFEVDRCILPQAASVSFPSVPGPSLFLVMSGKGTIVTGYSEEITFQEGEVLFVPAYMEVSITAAAIELHMYRAGVNNRFFGDL